MSSSLRGSQGGLDVTLGSGMGMNSILAELEQLMEETRSSRPSPSTSGPASPNKLPQRPASPLSPGGSIGSVGSGPGSPIDKSMLPGHNQSNLSAKLEATRAAFKAAQGASGGRPLSGRTSAGPRRDGERPCGYNCYLCGQQFGSASLFIHIPACQKKWLMVEAAKPDRRDRRPLPPPPPEIQAGQLPTSGREVDEFNTAMASYWDKCSLVGCPICGRTFRPDAFEKHQKVCTPDKPGGPLGPGKGPVRPAPGRGGGAGGRPVASARRGGGGGGGGGMMSKPRGYTCYLCGQQYGSASLFIHIPACQKKWLMVEAAKPDRRDRRPLPPPPDFLADIQELPTDPQGIDKFNSQMAGYWDKASLVPCRICGRTFRPEAFEKHQAVCTPDNPGGPLGMPKGASAARAAAARSAAMAKGGAGGGGGGGARGGGKYNARPRAYNCYLCGQQYGSTSLLIHIPQCYEKWLKVEAGKDPKQRREPPPPPPELDQPLPTTPEGIDAFNQRMSNAFNGVSLMACQHCGRTMRPEALAKHQKLCTAEAPMRAAGGGGGGGGAGGRAGPVTGQSAGGPSEYGYEGGDEEMAECANCGRRMRAEALVKHNKVCTADKPMKGVKRSPASGATAPQGVTSRTAQSGGSGGGGGGGGYGGGEDEGEYRPSPPRAPPPGSDRPSPRTAGRPAGRAGAGGLTSTQRGGAAAPQYEDEDGGQYDDGGGMSGGYNPPDDSAAYGGEDEMGRTECPTCGRRFTMDALEKHSRVCAKVFATKRKPFNAAKQRLQGTDAAGYARTTARPASTQQPRRQAAGTLGAGGYGGPGRGGKGGMPRWKAQSEELRAAMANMRQVNQVLAKGGDIRNIPYVPTGPDPSFSQCPHCGRFYNPQAFERHVPHCANTVAKPKFLKAGTGGAGKGAPQSKQLPRW